MNNKKTIYFFNERLVRALNQVFKVPFSIISAQIGAGKTTAVKALLSQSNVNVLWYSCPKNNEGKQESGFLAALGEMAGALDAQSGARLSGVLSEAGTLQGEEALRQVSQILRELAARRRLAIVIDDYTESEELLRLLYDLARQSIDNVFILILSREIIKNDFELGLSGNIFEMRNDLFMLDEADIVRYYQKAGISVSEETAGIIYRYSGGWIPFLQMMGDELSKNPDADINEKTFLNGMRQMENYVKQYFLSEVPRYLQEFLTAFGFMETFTLRFFSAFWQNVQESDARAGAGNTDAKEILNWLFAHNLFLEYDPLCKIYHFQYVFRLALRELYEQLPDRKQERLAGAYVRSVCAGRSDWNIVGHGDEGFLSHMPVLCGGPDEDITELLFQAFSFLICEDDMGFQRAMEVCEGWFSRHKPEPAAECQYRLLKGRLGRQGGTDGIFSYIRSCIRARSRERWQVGLAWGNLMAVMCLYEPGNLDERISSLEAELDGCEGEFFNYYKGWLFLLKGECHLLRYELDDAEICLYASERLIHREKEPTLELICVYLRVSCLYYGGKTDEAAALFREAREWQIRHGKIAFVRELDLGWSWLSEQSASGADMVSQPYREKNGNYYDHALEKLILARDMIQKKQYSAFVGYYYDQDRYYRDQNIYFRVYMLLFRAIACGALGRAEESREYFRAAAGEAMPDGIYLPFLVLEHELYSFLEETDEQDVQRTEFMRTLKEKTETYRNCRWGEGTGKLRKIDQCEALTKREREICYCAHEGLSNREIGAKLMISENTVKTAMKSIFRKMGITSRDML